MPSYGMAVGANQNFSGINVAGTSNIWIEGNLLTKSENQNPLFAINIAPSVVDVAIVANEFVSFESNQINPSAQTRNLSKLLINPASEPKLKLFGAPGKPYTLQFSLDLEQWSDFESIIPSPSGVLTSTISPQPGFYRLVEDLD